MGADAATAMSFAQTPALLDAAGRRKYLTSDEARRFAEAAGHFALPRAAFALTLLYTGCRISEALALTAFQIDAPAGAVVFRTLKRRRPHFRLVPVPDKLAAMLLELAARPPADGRLWAWSRWTAWRHIRTVMQAAGIAGPYATPRGLRHSYGVACMMAGIELDLTRRLMGHARLETTAIYRDVIGAEARAALHRLWAYQGAPSACHAGRTAHGPEHRR